MLTKYSALILLCTFCFVVTPTDNLNIHAQHEPGGIETIVKVVNTLLNDCKFQLNNIIIEDMSNNSTISDTLMKIRVPFPKLLTTKNSIPEKRLMQSVYMNSQGLIQIIDNQKNFIKSVQNIIDQWPCNVNCIVIVVITNGDICRLISSALFRLGLSYIENAFFICVRTDQIPILFTHSLGKKYFSSFWQHALYRRQGPIEWTLYYGGVKKDFSTFDICHNLVNNGTNLNQQPTIKVGMSSKDYLKQKALYYYGIDNIKNLVDQKYFQNAKIFERLLKTELYYYIKPFTSEEKDRINLLESLNSNFADIIISPIIIYRSNRDSTSFMYAGANEQLIIISQNRGLATPLEKIAKYYGLVTLVSLLIILLITFIVVWLKTNRNITWAMFDIIRLLINSDVTVSLNTLSIKIFFSMIFLYFLILHATFSGHLAEFLTIPQNRDNIDSVEDLKDSRITKIYTRDFIFKNVENYEFLNQKISIIETRRQCIDLVLEDHTSVCIAPKYILLNKINEENLDNKLYNSKNAVSTETKFMMSYRRFPYLKKFNWALYAATETRLLDHFWDIETKNVDRLISKKKALSEIDFRPIALNDLKFPFIFLIIGNSLGFICFLIELFVGRRLHVYFTFENFRRVLMYLKKVFLNIVKPILVLKIYVMRHITRN